MRAFEARAAADLQCASVQRAVRLLHERHELGGKLGGRQCIASTANRERRQALSKQLKRSQAHVDDGRMVKETIVAEPFEVMSAITMRACSSCKAETMCQHTRETQARTGVVRLREAAMIDCA